MSTEPGGPTTMEQFERLLDTHGAELARWPQAERTFAKALLESNPAAVALLADYQEFEASLNQLAPIAASPELRRQVFEIPLRHPKASTLMGTFFSRWWLPALAAGCVLFAGGVSGWASSVEPSASFEEEEDWSEVSEMALAMDLDEAWE